MITKFEVQVSEKEIRLTGCDETTAVFVRTYKTDDRFDNCLQAIANLMGSIATIHKLKDPNFVFKPKVTK